MNSIEVFASPTNTDVAAVQAYSEDNHWVLHFRDERLEVIGRLIGFASSRRPVHVHASQRGSSAERCQACRWQEVRIIFVTGVIRGFAGNDMEITNGARFVVHTLGPSTVPGERTFSRCEIVQTGYEVVELLTVRRGDKGEPYLPAAAARALAQAAGVDRSIQDAYVNRAVA